MGEMKVEHVLLFLVGAFLAYHMMKKIEGLYCPLGCIQKEHCSSPSDLDACHHSLNACWNNK